MIQYDYTGNTVTYSYIGATPYISIATRVLHHTSLLLCGCYTIHLYCYAGGYTIHSHGYIIHLYYYAGATLITIASSYA